MTDRITADPGRLTAFSAVTRRTIAPALDATADHSAAIRAYQSAPNDLSTRCFVDHGGTVEALLTDLATFDELPEAFARALNALDGRMGPALALSADVPVGFVGAVDAALLDPSATADELRRAAADGADGDTPVWKLVWNAYDHPNGAYGSVVSLVNVGRWGRATSRLQHVEAMATTSHLDLRWTGLNRAGRRAMARQLVRQGRRALPGARAAAAAADDAMRAGRGPLAGLASRVPPRVASTAGALARPLGFAGVGIGAWETYGHIDDGQWVDAGFSGAGMVGGGLLLVAGGPVTLTVGGVLVLGSLGYEYREEIADGARWVWDKGGDAIGAVGDGLGSLADGVGDLAGGLADKAEDIPVIGGLFD